MPREQAKIMRTTRRSSLPDTQRPTTERLQCGRGGAHPSQRIMRTTRRSSLPTDHADDTEVIPPALQTGRVRLRADRSACVPRIMWTTRRSSLPCTQRPTTERLQCGRRGGHPSRTLRMRPVNQHIADSRRHTTTKQRRESLTFRLSHL